jgi:signal transduction histidine kinase
MVLSAYICCLKSYLKAHKKSTTATKLYLSSRLCLMNRILIAEDESRIAALASRDWRLEKKGSGRIVADRQRLTQAIVNLDHNATQHTQDRDVIALGSAVTDGEVRFWARDTGEGIALADQQRIFERFARGTNSGRRSEGASLGLAIVQAIALAHGGQIEMFSRPGGGSTFTLVMPIDLPRLHY